MIEWFNKRMPWHRTISDAPNATTIKENIDTPTTPAYVDIGGPIGNLPLASCTPVSIGTQSERRLSEFSDMLNYDAWKADVRGYTDTPVKDFVFTRKALLKDAINKITFSNTLGFKGNGLKVDIPVGQLLNAFSTSKDYMNEYRDEYLKQEKDFRINHNLYPPIKDTEQHHIGNATEHYGRLVKTGWDNEAGAKSCIVVFSSAKEVELHNRKANQKDIIIRDMDGKGRISVYKWLPNADAAEKVYLPSKDRSIPGQVMLSMWYQVDNVPIEFAYWMAARQNHIGSGVTSTIIKSEFEAMGENSYEVDTQCVTTDPGWLSLEQKRLTGVGTTGTIMSQRSKPMPFAYKSFGEWSNAIGTSNKIMKNFGSNGELISISNGANNTGTYLLASVPQIQMLVTHFNAGSQRVTPNLAHASLGDTGPRYTFNTHGLAREVRGLGHIQSNKVEHHRHNSVQVLTIGMWNRTALFKTAAIVRKSSDTWQRVEDYVCPNRDLMLFR